MRKLLVISVMLLLVCTLSCAGGGSGALQSSAPGQQARAQLADIAALESPSGIDATLWEQLKATLQDALVGMHGLRSASSVPSAASGAVQDFTLTPQDDETLLCTWTYRNTGDYDQSGEVNVADLVPIGLHFGATSADADWAAASLADGDGNGVVNISDVTPIARNWLARVDGYMIRRSTSTTQDSGWEDIARVELADGAIPEGSGALRFSLTLDTPYPGRSYGATPYLQGSSGIEPLPAGNAPRFEPPLPAAPLGLQASDGEFIGKVELSWTPVPWATGYSVFRDSQAEPFAQIGDSASYSDMQVYDVYEHTYWVRAKNSSGQSEFSAPDAGQMFIA